MAAQGIDHVRIPVHLLDVPLNKERFLKNLISELSAVLESIVGLEDASGFISIVGQNIGNEMDLDYKRALATSTLNLEQVAAVLVDLKARINGDFYVIEMNAERIVLGNRACPFGADVIGRKSMCMMTSNVFGVIAAQNLGYAKVALEQTIAEGDVGCRVVVHLKENPTTAAVAGQEYYHAEL